MQHFLDLFISINCSTCVRQFLHPSSGAQNCTYSVRYCQTNTAACCCRGWDGTPLQAVLVWQYLTLYVQFCALDNGRRNRLKHVEQIIEINRSRKRCIFWLYFRYILAMHRHINVKFFLCVEDNTLIGRSFLLKLGYMLFVTNFKVAINIPMFWVHCALVTRCVDHFCLRCKKITFRLNPLNPDLNPTCYLLTLLAHHFLHVSRIRVKSLTLRLLMSYIWSAYSWCF